VFIPGGAQLRAGDLVRARIVEADKYDLVGELY
jgi:hypothetical protein